MEFMKQIISGFIKEGRHGTAHVYQSTYNRINDFIGGRVLTFSEITPSWLKSFQGYLLTRQLQWNSISTYMRMIRAVYYRAVDEGLARPRFRLFHGVYTGTRVTVKRAVGMEVFQSLKKPIAGHNTLEKTRLLFLLLFMLRGIPFVDIAYMRWCDLAGDTLTYRRRKTGAWLTVKIEPEAMRIIRVLQSTDSSSPYIFPLIRNPGKGEYKQYQHALRYFNRNLKKISLLFGKEVSLSSYSARHSWATIANFQNYQQELISNAMGHSSVKVTETYFKRHSDDRIHAMNKEMISYVFS